MKKKILHLIHKYDTIILHRHCHPDLDAIGSQAGLAELIKATYPKKRVYLAGTNNHKFSFLAPMDDVSDKDYEGALVIVCDTDDRENIDDKRYEMGDCLLKIDHHPNHDEYGDFSWIDTSSSSVCEMIYELYEFGKYHGYPLMKKTAYLLYAGIIGDTGRFKYPNTTEKTLSIAGKLLAKDFSTEELFTRLETTALSSARLKGYILQHFQITSSGVGYIKLSADVLQQLEVTVDGALQFINVFSTVENIKVWIFFIETPNQINVRVRSNRIAVRQLAKTFGGGGHVYSAGMAVHNWHQAEMVLHILEDMCCEWKETIV